MNIPSGFRARSYSLCWGHITEFTTDEIIDVKLLSDMDIVSLVNKGPPM